MEWIWNQFHTNISRIQLILMNQLKCKLNNNNNYTSKIYLNQLENEVTGDIHKKAYHICTFYFLQSIMKLSKLFQLTIFLRFSAAAGSSSPSESRQADDGPGDMGVGGAVLASSALFSSLRVADLRRVILIVSDVVCGIYKLKYIKISSLSEKLFHVRRVSTRTASDFNTC